MVTAKIAFVALNLLRLISLVGLVLLLTTLIIGLVEDVDAFHNDETMDEAVREDCAYVPGTSIPMQTWGIFWVELHRMLLMIAAVCLFLSECGWLGIHRLDRLAEQWMPLLTTERGLAALGAVHVVVAISILSHHLDEFPMIVSWILFVVGVLYLTCGAAFHRRRLRDVRSLFVHKRQRIQSEQHFGSSRSSVSEKHRASYKATGETYYGSTPSLATPLTSIKKLFGRKARAGAGGSKGQISINDNFPSVETASHRELLEERARRAGHQRNGSSVAIDITTHAGDQSSITRDLVWDSVNAVVHERSKLMERPESGASKHSSSLISVASSTQVRIGGYASAEAARARARAKRRRLAEQTQAGAASLADPPYSPACKSTGASSQGAAQQALRNVRRRSAAFVSTARSRLSVGTTSALTARKRSGKRGLRNPDREIETSYFHDADTVPPVPPLPAARLDVTLSKDPATCAPLAVSWDASKGTGPWTVTVAPLGHNPVAVALPANYMPGNAWTWSWNVPGYSSAVSQIIVAVSDSTGKTSGTSSLARLAKSGSCAAPIEELDFIWYPSKSDPRQCDDWKFTVQEDTGNLGLRMPVDILLLPEDLEPTRIRITDDKDDSIDWTVNYPSGTKFAVAAFDAGRSGSGGVGGDVYTIASGKSAFCISSTQKEAVAGLPGASSTVAAAPATSRMATIRTSATGVAPKASGTSTHAPTAVSDSASSNVEKASSGAAVGGGIGGGLAALAIVGGLVFLYRKRSQDSGPDEYGVYQDRSEKKSFFSRFGSNGGIDGKGDANGGISPFTAGRASPWRWSSKPESAAETSQDAPPSFADERRAIVSRFNDAASSVGRSSSVSLHRDRNSFGAGANSTPFGGPGGIFGASSVHSVVPDEALFPPPRPTHGTIAGFGVAVGVGAGAAVGSRERSYSNTSGTPSDPFGNPPLPLQKDSETQHPPQSQPLTRTNEPRSSDQRPRHPASRDSIAALAGLPLSPSSAYAQSSLYRSPSRELIRPPGSGPVSNPFANPSSSSPASSIQQHRVPSSNPRLPSLAPVQTSAFDPFPQSQSRSFSNDTAHVRAGLGANAESLDDPYQRTMSATPTSATGPRYVDPRESAALFRSFDAQLRDDRKKVVSRAYSDASTDDGGLPYM
ncbi:hypothetical protein BCV70DRAFT_215932 [Testicularia cyperi]|uniref:Uncharacterized protein n=1 Tax=Testicularia cyperi TaxID=1882483 RepID=A0A317XUC7_9BASI|nr:hypothetical protein BCV70DRAFT_215932 [Testicularia cyperi]